MSEITNSPKTTKVTKIDFSTTISDKSITDIATDSPISDELAKILANNRKHTRPVTYRRPSYLRYIEYA